MTERLYYTHAYLREFDASIVRVDSRGGRLSIVLDRTAFYPTSGGQPFDTGTLAAARSLHVIDTVDDEESGDVAHIVDGSPDEVTAGQPVRGLLDWGRRFDHMQQHTGQHVLSAAIDRLYGVRTVSFHLGTESSTIDLSRELTRDQLTAAEREANAVIWDDRLVSVRFASAEDAARLPLRKESSREGTVRLIDIEDFDLSACGGTHVARTGGIGIIAVGATARFKGGQRIEFFCGARALAGFRSMRDVLTGAVRLLSVMPDELSQAIGKLQDESRERQRALNTLQNELARYRAEDLIRSAEERASGRLVAGEIDADAVTLKSLASAICSRPGYIAAFVSTSKPSLAIVARSEDVGIDANHVIRLLTQRFGGRGGGKPDLAQAGGLNADAAAILEAVRRAIS